MDERDGRVVRINGQPRRDLRLLTLFVDTNVIDAMDESSVLLRRLAEAGWIYLRKTDVLDTELSGASDGVRDDLLALSRQYPEEFGPFTFDHSRLDHAVLATEHDEQRHRKVFEILFPSAVFDQARKNDLRDAKHIATAIRAGANGFVTHDKRLCRKSSAIAEDFAGHTIYSPVEAVSRTSQLIARRRELHRREPDRGLLPDWPPD